MPAVSAERLAGALSCAAISASGATLAVCPNGSDAVVLYERSPAGGWQEAETLQGHEGTVSGLSFDGADRLVSSSHDRNSFVWTRQGGSWVPELAVTRLTRAGLAVAWSPTSSGKFAIGSSDATVSLCYFDAGRGLWAPRLIRNKHTSSVTAVAWHPSGAVLATVSTDGHCRLFNALVAEVDGPGRPAALQSSRFGDCLLELEIACGSWGLAVAWSPDGRTLAFSSQRSEVELLPGIDLEEAGSLQRAAEQRQAVAVPGLPLKALSFVSDSVLAGGGFDCAPLVFKRQADGQWHFLRKLQGLERTSSRVRSSQLLGRIKMFEQGGAQSCAKPGSEDPHENCIVGFIGGAGESRFTTAGSDGRIVEWLID